MIGRDYPKIEWQFAGLDLLEPNAMIGDLILFSTALVLAAKIKTNYPQNDFYTNWIRFYLVFGWSFLFGGFGHLFYNFTICCGFPSRSHHKKNHSIKKKGTIHRNMGL